MFFLSLLKFIILFALCHCVSPSYMHFQYVITYFVPPQCQMWGVQSKKCCTPTSKTVVPLLLRTCKKQNTKGRSDPLLRFICMTESLSRVQTHSDNSVMMSRNECFEILCRLFQPFRFRIKNSKSVVQRMNNRTMNDPQTHWHAPVLHCHVTERSRLSVDSQNRL